MKRIFIGIAVIVLLLIGIWFSNLPSDNSSTTGNVKMVNKLQDAHGLAVDRQDSNKVYVATHTGLLVMNNDGAFETAGTAKDDYMGFSAHPTDPNTFYTSGHARRGGNLGFQKSTDGGKTWEKVSNGVNGPVDFHAMTVSQKDPRLAYGYYGGQLQRSRDEGKNWEILNGEISNILVLATDFSSKDTVYAGAADGLYISQNQGDTWTKVDAINGAVTTMAVSPGNDKEITTYVQGQGLVRSTDAGKTWTKLSGYSAGMAMHLAYSVQEPATSYLVNRDLEIYKTIDDGQEWVKVRQ